MALAVDHRLVGLERDVQDVARVLRGQDRLLVAAQAGDEVAGGGGSAGARAAGAAVRIGCSSPRRQAMKWRAPASTALMPSLGISVAGRQSPRSGPSPIS